MMVTKPHRETVGHVRSGQDEELGVDETSGVMDVGEDGKSLLTVHIGKGSEPGPDVVCGGVSCS